MKNNKKIIFILLGIFTVLVLVFISFRNTNDLENCADDHLNKLILALNRPTRPLKSMENMNIDYYKNLQKLSIKEKMKDDLYKDDMLFCEREKKKSPETFKLQYGW
jgi:cell shape-determining protein MreC